MEKRRPGQGGRGKPEGFRKPGRENPGRSEKRSTPAGKPWEDRGPKRDEGRTERPERRGKPEGKPWEERRPKRDESRTERPERRSKPEGKPWEERKPKRDEGRTERPERRGKPEGKPWENRGPKRDERRTERPERRGKPEGKPWAERRPGRDDEKAGAFRGKPRTRSSEKEENIRLNKYISNSGVCSRREADTLITAGVVRVNGKIVTELGMKVSPGDKVQVEERNISMEKPQYVLLNKPKGFITTVEDPKNRPTVMTLIKGACKERVYPVGRLDMNTTGLLLFTNDGNIAKKLTHPKYGIKKIYHVELDKSLSKADYEHIRKGVELEDGIIVVDKIEFIEESKSRKEIGLELHSGQNRIVRRIFEHFEYKVVRLDRVYYAGLTKKNLPRGHWRLLEEKDINMLKMISS